MKQYASLKRNNNYRSSLVLMLVLMAIFYISHVLFNLFFLSSQIPQKVGIAEVVGSNPTRSTFIILVNYGIRLSSIWVVVGQKC
jgi:hypothetical protein